MKRISILDLVKTERLHKRIGEFESAIAKLKIRVQILKRNSFNDIKKLTEDDSLIIITLNSDIMLDKKRENTYKTEKSHINAELEKSQKMLAQFPKTYSIALAEVQMPSILAQKNAKNHTNKNKNNKIKKIQKIKNRVANAKKIVKNAIKKHNNDNQKLKKTLINENNKKNNNEKKEKATVSKDLKKMKKSVINIEKKEKENKKKEKANVNKDVNEGKKKTKDVSNKLNKIKITIKKDTNKLQSLLKLITIDDRNI